MKTWLLLIGGFIGGAIAYKLTMDFLFPKDWDSGALAIWAFVLSFFTLFGTIGIIDCRKK